MLRYQAIMLIFVSTTLPLIAQTKKMEREKRVKREVLPQAAINVLEGFIAGARKVRYYHETDGEKVSFEVKFLRNKRHYSVEFNEAGGLEDVELLVRFDQLSETLRENILKHLSQYDKYKIRKTQQQFSSPSQPDEQIIKASLEGLFTEIVRYEIIIETKSQGSWTTYEMLFDEKGDFISQKEVIGRLADHILY